MTAGDMKLRQSGYRTSATDDVASEVGHRTDGALASRVLMGLLLALWAVLIPGEAMRFVDSPVSWAELCCGHARAPRTVMRIRFVRPGLAGQPRSATFARPRLRRASNRHAPITPHLTQAPQRARTQRVPSNSDVIRRVRGAD